MFLTILPNVKRAYYYTKMVLWHFVFQDTSSPQLKLFIQPGTANYSFVTAVKMVSLFYTRFLNYLTFLFLCFFELLFLRWLILILNLKQTPRVVSFFSFLEFWNSHFKRFFNAKWRRFRNYLRKWDFVKSLNIPVICQIYATFLAFMHSKNHPQRYRI